MVICFKLVLICLETGCINFFVCLLHRTLVRSKLYPAKPISVTEELVKKIPEGHANLQQILQQKRLFNKAVENNGKACFKSCSPIESFALLFI